MFSAIFQDHYAYLTGCALAAFALGGAAWWVAHRLGSPHGRWWAGFAATLTAMIGVTFMGSGPASGQCIINHNPIEPFRATQGLWNLAMTVPLGFFAMLASRRPLPTLVGVIALPLAIEFIQGSVDGLGRVCDSADAEMNILGGIAGAAVAALVLARNGRVNWRAGVKAALIVSAGLLVIGVGVARPAVSFTHVDGTGLSAADSAQRKAVEEVVQEAFGDRYILGHVYDQPCVGAPCANVVFNLLSRDKAHPDVFGSGTLSWPDKKRLNILLEDSDRPTVMGFPVPGAKAPSSKEEAYEATQLYMRSHYPWARDAVAHETYPIGEKAELGWMTGWRWTNNGVLMPRMLDVQVDKLGRVSQINVVLGPTRLDLEKSKLNAKQAEQAVRDALTARAGGRGLPDDLRLNAFTLKAVERDGKWRSEWLVNLAVGEEGQQAAPPASGAGDMWWVDSVSGEVYDSAFAATKTG
ncbi:MULTISPECIES: VanZ family protein [Streptomyces]|uniref:VanZ-like domain-containing protein n=1 Tax=Streptomyces viridochromogenes TaxID=1938 RepID=A0A0L8KCF5_STRVR|nr:MULTISPECIES: VanZ family protein [Streptomyces]KOG23540.1 hypothetical protein ADK34_19945 [Streptomyces viridochromogenes]